MTNPTVAGPYSWLLHVADVHVVTCTADVHVVTCTADVHVVTCTADVHVYMEPAFQTKCVHLFSPCL